MATHAKFFRNTVNAFFCLAFFCAGEVQAAFVAASSDMAINNLRFALSDTSAQLQWTDVWYGDVRAHAADSDSVPDNDSNSLFGNDGSIQAIANTAHVSSLADYTVENGTQIGLDPNAGITGTTHSDLHLERKHMQADGFAVSAFDNFFTITNPNATETSVWVDFLLDYQGSILGTADAEGFFVDITHIATLRLFDINGLLSFDQFQDSISGTNTTILHENQGTLRVSFLLDYNKTYQISAEADSEIYGYTVPTPATLPLILLGVTIMRRFHRC